MLALLSYVHFDHGIFRDVTVTNQNIIDKSRKLKSNLPSKSNNSGA